MAINFSKINPSRAASRPTDPEDIFHSCTISDETINDLWLAQGDALRDYHRNRGDSDIAIALNTGAGKTMVGLLIAQSLVNETGGRVVYACASIQLIEQTHEKARGYGLDVTTYYQGDFSDHGYESGLTPCLTTYQALFNGKTIFRRHDVAAVIFDDAHAADHILRDQFTLNIARSEMEKTYLDIHSLFVEFHRDTGLDVSYKEVLTDTTSNRTFWIPPSVVYETRSTLIRTLLTAGLTDCESTKFAWDHLKNHIDRCCVLVSGRSVTITPPFIPVHTLPYFSAGVRRVYLSATLRAPDAFARSFGRVPQRVISPTTTAGECERLVLIPSNLPHSTSPSEEIASLLEGHKALILVPTHASAEKWRAVATLQDRQTVASQVREFRDSDTGRKDKLVLVGRYDGVDLPGDTCRLLVIDGLPMGSGPLEHYLWRDLGMASWLRYTIAARLVQSFGRISRGMSDHGVVVLNGEELVKWLSAEKHRLLLPDYLAGK